MVNGTGGFQLIRFAGAVLTAFYMFKCFLRSLELQEIKNYTIILMSRNFL